MTDRKGEMFSAEDRTVAIGQTRSSSLLRLGNLRRAAVGYVSRSLALHLCLMLRGYDYLDSFGESNAQEWGDHWTNLRRGRLPENVPATGVRAQSCRYWEHRRRPHSRNRLRDLTRKPDVSRAFLLSRKGSFSRPDWKPGDIGAFHLT